MKIIVRVRQTRVTENNYAAKWKRWYCIDLCAEN